MSVWSMATVIQNFLRESYLSYQSLNASMEHLITAKDHAQSVILNASPVLTSPHVSHVTRQLIESLKIIFVYASRVTFLLNMKIKQEFA